MYDDDLEMLSKACAPVEKTSIHTICRNHGRSNAISRGDVKSIQVE